MATFDDFQKLDMRVGEITRAEAFPKARKPAYKLWVDFGEEIGIKQSSAQITDCYGLDELVGKQVLGVINFPTMKVADFSSEVLVMGVYSDQGVVLIEPQQKVKKGDRLGYFQRTQMIYFICVLFNKKKTHLQLVILCN
ncbi:tRNA-binding protein [Bacillus sp. AFS096315]|nr:tRNA-binding protein [Bacillus sp. AFS096315]